MLYPLVNSYRSIHDLSGIWDFKTDPNKIGEKNNWYKGFKTNISIAVPGSWNEQLEELGLLNYVGSVWYSKKIFIPIELKSKRILLRFGSIDYNAKFWIDGKFVGENNIGFLPIELEVNDFVTPGKEALIVIKVNNELSHESIPQGITSQRFRSEKRLREETNPPTRFDFSPFGGIHRTAQLVATPKIHIKKIIVDTKISNKKDGIITAEIFSSINKNLSA